MSKKKIKVYMGIPSTGERTDGQCYRLRDIEKKYADEVEFVYPEICTFRLFHDFARNAIVEEFLKTDCDVLWFLDSDVVPPVSIMDLVVYPAKEWKLAGATYPVWMTLNQELGPQAVLTCYKKINGKLAKSEVPTSGIGFVDGLATGCLFIKREVFERLSKPYFEFKYDETTREMSEGEDLGFCRKMSDLGYQFYTDFSLVCKHYKRVDLLDVNNYAMAYTKQKINEYDAMVRPKIEALQKVIAAKKQAKAPQSPIEEVKTKIILPHYYK